MKITFATSDYPNFISGVHSWLRRFVLELKSSSHECCFLVFTEGKSNFLFIDFLVANNFEFKQLDFNHFPFTPERTAWIIDEVKKSKSDVFVPGFSVAGLYATPWLKKAHITTVIFVHSDDKFWKGAIERFVCNPNDQWNGDVVFSVSKFLFDYIGPKLSNHYCAPCGIVPSQIYSTFKKPFRIIYFGRVEQEQKRIIDTVRGLIHVLKRVPDLEFDIYGSGSEVEAVKEIIDKEANNLPVRYMGISNSEETATLLSQYHAFILLSDYEGLPVSLLEAMSCGVVPVCMNIRSGINEVVISGENGYLVDDRSESVYRVLQAMASDRDLWQALSTNASASVNQKFGIRAQVTEFINIVSNYKPAKQQQLKISSRITLPPAHPDLHYTFEDVRQIPFMERAIAAIRIYLGALRRKAGI
jgi:colanic acid/amylovoran biosynthesis glycosyltransferase